jgi:hypothetical protein
MKDKSVEVYETLLVGVMDLAPPYSGPTGDKALARHIEEAAAGALEALTAHRVTERHDHLHEVVDRLREICVIAEVMQRKEPPGIICGPSGGVAVPVCGKVIPDLAEPDGFVRSSPRCALQDGHPGACWPGLGNLSPEMRARVDAYALAVGKDAADEVEEPSVRAR